MTRRYTDIAGKIDAHWSLFNRLRDNWGLIAAGIGLSGLSGWFVWIWEEARAAPWYQKSLFAVLGVLLVAFLVTGTRAFWVFYRRSIREEGAIALGLSWSGHTYANGSVIEGGTHRLVEIFGKD